MKTSELTGAALDWAVRYALNGKPYSDYVEARDNFSTCWAKGGPIIEREGMQIYRIDQSFWGTTIWWDDEHGASEFTQKGPTPLTAAMRCYVASKLGDTVDIPKELTQ